MEIASLSKNEIRIKSKNATLIVNPVSSLTNYSGGIYLQSRKKSEPLIQDGAVIISAPGEFEIGGIKIRGLTQSGLLYYSLEVDGVGILLGNLSVLEKVHSKLQEYPVVLVNVDESLDPSFLTGFATNALVYFGHQSRDTIQSFVKDGITQSTKVAFNKDKLPHEMETVVLTGR